MEGEKRRKKERRELQWNKIEERRRVDERRVE